MDSETVFLGGFFLVLVVIGAIIVGGVGFAIYYTVSEKSAESRCAELGWRDAKVTVPNFKQYCINRTDQTDIIKPLSELE